MKKEKKILDSLTLEEKISLLCGHNFWDTVSFPEKDLPSFSMADGPYGLRKQEGISDHMGWNVSVPATAYPCGPAIAASWNRELIEKMGSHLGQEAKENSVDILLGPAINIVRTPLNGRNFEYYSEDPYLTGEMGTSYVKGVQGEGVGSCIKHFACNNQETDREYIDTVVSKRALHEIYLAAFEKIIKETKPTAVMTALNKVNGKYCSENEILITDILRGLWGFKGITISDWSGVNDRVKALAAGLDLEMPCSHGVGAKRIAEGLAAGKITEDDIDRSCLRLIKTAIECRSAASDISANSLRGGSQCLSTEDRSPYPRSAVWVEPKPEARSAVNGDKYCEPPRDLLAHHDFARRAAEESFVLLKNDEGILPLSKKTPVAIFGAYAKKPRFQMDGSALVNPSRVDIPLDEIQKISEVEISFTAKISEAKRLAREVEACIVMIGIPKGVEAEGKDRRDISLPKEELKLLEAVCKENKNIIVVLSNGAPIEMPWLKSVKAVVESFLAGQTLGSALARILFGEVNPSGKLPVTFPKKIEHTPAYLNFPGNEGRVKYNEDIFVGYRYYDLKNIEPLFPFGYGLSYTEFKYKNLVVDHGTAVACRRGSGAYVSSVPSTPNVLQGAHDAVASTPTKPTAHRENICPAAPENTASHLPPAKPPATSINEASRLTVSCSVKNTGKVSGAEIVQLYIAPPKTDIPHRPSKELKGFEKIFLKKNETGVVQFELDFRSFAFYDTGLNAWHANEGEYEIMIGSSSADIRLFEKIYFKPKKKRKEEITGWSTVGKLRSSKEGKRVFEEIKELLRNSGSPELLDLPLFDESRESRKRVSDLPLRMITLLSNNVINNDIMDNFLDRINLRSEE